MTISRAEHEFYQSPGDYEALFGPGLDDLTFYLQKCRQHVGPFLELGCGTGRLLWPLRQEGIAIEGLDSNPSMLLACEAEGQKLGLKAPLHLGDWRNFDLQRKFGAILFPFNGLQHLLSTEDLNAFFICLRRHLAPQGAFIFDVHQPQMNLLARNAFERFGVDEGPRTPRGEQVVVAEQSRYDPLSQVLTQVWTLSTGDGESRELVLPMRQFFPQELLLLLRSNGFRVETRFGTFQGAALTPMSLKQIISCISFESNGR